MMHTSSYKYGFSGSSSNPYYSFSNIYEINDYVPRLDGGRRTWDYSASPNSIDLPHVVTHGVESMDTSIQTSPEECKFGLTHIVVFKHVMFGQVMAERMGRTGEHLCCSAGYGFKASIITSIL